MMNYRNTISKTRCHICNKVFDQGEIIRIYGEESSIAKHRVCSSKCDKEYLFYKQMCYATTRPLPMSYEELRRRKKRGF